MIFIFIETTDKHIGLYSRDSKKGFHKLNIAWYSARVVADDIPGLVGEANDDMHVGGGDLKLIGRIVTRKEYTVYPWGDLFAIFRGGRKPYLFQFGRNVHIGEVELKANTKSNYN